MQGTLVQEITAQVPTGTVKTAHWHAGLVRKGCVGACGHVFQAERNVPSVSTPCAACLEAQMSNTVVTCGCAA